MNSRSGEQETSRECCTAQYMEILEMETLGRPDTPARCLLRIRDSQLLDAFSLTADETCCGVLLLCCADARGACMPDSIVHLPPSLVYAR